MRTLREHCVLVVEDNADDVLFIQRAMRKTGIKCPIQVVGDGEAAVEYLEARGPFSDRGQFPSPTLVLLDLKLPRRSGLEVLKWIRGDGGLHKLTVVMLTGSQEVTDVNAAYVAGANSYLVKPISPSAMSELVQTLSLYWLVTNEPAS
jgi:CheY-like chemotaxis protein